MTITTDLTHVDYKTVTMTDGMHEAARIWTQTRLSDGCSADRVLVSSLRLSTSSNGFAAREGSIRGAQWGENVTITANPTHIDYKYVTITVYARPRGEGHKPRCPTVAPPNCLLVSSMRLSTSSNGFAVRRVNNPRSSVGQTCDHNLTGEELMCARSKLG
jgi:hypothetical protein